MKTGRVTLTTTEFCEVKRKPAAFSLCWMLPGWILVLFSGSCIETTAQSLEIGHFNEMDSVQLVDSWDSIFCPEDFGLTISFFFFCFVDCTEYLLSCTDFEKMFKLFFFFLHRTTYIARKNKFSLWMRFSAWMQMLPSRALHCKGI